MMQRLRSMTLAIIHIVQKLEFIRDHSVEVSAMNEPKWSYIKCDEDEEEAKEKRICFHRIFLNRNGTFHLSKRPLTHTHASSSSDKMAIMIKLFASWMRSKVQSNAKFKWKGCKGQKKCWARFCVIRQRWIINRSSATIFPILKYRLDGGHACNVSFDRTHTHTTNHRKKEYEKRIVEWALWMAISQRALSFVNAKLNIIQFYYKFYAILRFFFFRRHCVIHFIFALTSIGHFF